MSALGTYMRDARCEMAGEERLPARFDRCGADCERRQLVTSGPSASHACPEMLAFVLGSGRPRSSLKVDRSLKGSPQSWIVDPYDVLFENGYSPRILECDDRPADFAACAAKEARRRWPPLVPDRVGFIGHGKCSRLVFGIAGDGKTQEEQEPFADSAGPPILRNELLHLISCHLGDRLYFAAPRRNGGASFMHGAGLDPKAAAFQHGA